MLRVSDPSCDSPRSWASRLARWLATGAGGPAIASALLAVVLYAVTLGGTWVYDDLHVARDDPRLHQPGQWLAFLHSGYFVDALDNLWRPLTSLSFALQWHLHGGQAWALHAVNIALHAVASALVAAFVWRLASQRDIQAVSEKPVSEGRATIAGYVAGQLFAAHPVHVEAVAYLVGRAESLAAIGTLGALFLIARSPLTFRRAFGVYGCFLVALLAKEQGLLLPPMLLIYFLLFRRRRETDSEESKGFKSPKTNTPALLLAFLLLATLAAYISYRDSFLPWYWERVFLDSTINPLVLSRGLDRWLIPVSILGRYAVLLIAPWRLSPDYSYAVFTHQFHANDPYFYAGLLTLAVSLIGLGWSLLRRRRAIAFCLLSMGMTYFLISNSLIIIGTIFGERLIYLPSAFACILAGLAVSNVSRRSMTPTPRPRLRRLAFTTIFLAVLLAASVRTITYAARWNDRLRFYEISLREQPKSAQLYLLLAQEWTWRGEDAKAAAVLADARQAAPDAWKVWLQSARASLHANRFDEARRFLDHAFDLRIGSSYIVSLQEEIDAAEEKQRQKPNQNQDQNQSKDAGQDRHE